MRRHLITLLAVITLLSQWGWVEHAYHHHEGDKVCEICASASGHVAVIPAIPQLPHFQGSDFSASSDTQSFYAVARRFYSVRAPPRFL